MGILLNTAGFIEKINSHVPEKLKEALNFSCFFLIFALNLFIYSLEKGNRWMLAVLSGSLITLVIVFLNIRRDTFARFRMKKPYFILIELIGVSLLINGLYFATRGYIAVGIVFSLLLPAVHLTAASIGIEKTARMLSKAAVLSFIILLPCILLFGDPLDFQYSGFYDNPNLLGNYLCTVYCGLLFLVYIHRKRAFKNNLFLYILMAADFSFCFFTASRTSIMTIILLSAVFLILIIVLQSRERGSRTALLTGKIILTALIMLPLVLLMVTGIFSNLKNLGPEEKKDSTGAMVQVYNYLFKGIEVEKPVDISDTEKHTGTVTVDYENFSSGRSEIWKCYLKNIGFSGHASEEREISAGDRYYEATNAHNVYIQLAYSGGIVCGAAMLLLILLCGIDILVKLIDEIKIGRISRETLFAGLGAGGFLLPSFTSSGYMMFSYLPATLFWLGMAGLSIKTQDIRKKADEI